MLHIARTIGSTAAAVALCLVAGNAAADPAALADSARCTMCHDAQAPRLGPSWAAVAERYRGQEGAAEMLAARVRAGSAGEWGKAPMPAVSEEQLSDGDLMAVLGWVLEH